MDEIQLEFKGPFSFTDAGNSIFNIEHENTEGIYLWTTQQENEQYHLIHYIGQSQNVAARQQDHLTAILGLHYGIYDPKKAQKGISELIWEGTWRHTANTVPSKQLKAYKEKNQLVLEYISTLNIFYAKTNIPKNARLKIEGKIAAELRKTEYKALYPDDNRTTNPPEMFNKKVIINSSKEIKGLVQSILI